MKKVAVVFAMMIVVVLLVILFSTRQKRHEGVSKPLVSVSTFALYDAARNIAADEAEIFMVTPFGTDLHSFEPTAQLFAKVERSDLFIYSGAGLEPWTKGFAAHKNALDMSTKVRLQAGEACEEHDEPGHEHHEEVADPHYWLDIENMARAAKVISIALEQLAPQHARLFKRNAAAYIERLESLDAEFREVLSQCRIDTIVLNHNAFGYLSGRYGFHAEALSGFSPEAMPSARTMMELSDLVKAKGITTLFFESFVSDALMQSIAAESGAKVEVLFPLANITADQADANATYESLMRENLAKLAAAMECR